MTKTLQQVIYIVCFLFILIFIAKFNCFEYFLLLCIEIIKGKIKNNILKKMKLFEKPKPKKLKKKKNPYEDYELLNMISGDGLNEEHGHQNVNKEMEKYLNLNISLSEVSMDGSDLLTWWKSSRLSFPILFKVAM